MDVYGVGWKPQLCGTLGPCGWRNSVWPFEPEHSNRSEVRGVAIAALSHWPQVSFLPMGEKGRRRKKYTTYWELVCGKKSKCDHSKAGLTMFD